MSFTQTGIEQKRLPSGAKVIIYNLKKVKIHIYVAPEKSFGNATHIIETPNYLSLVDTQYQIPYSKEFRKYANSLNKVIAGVIISHAHPDHYFGLTSSFNDVLSYALPKTIEDIKNKGPIMIQEGKKELGDLVPDHVTVPTNVLHMGDVVVDGLTFRYRKYDKAEADTQVVIELPELKTVIVQDAISNRYHPWMGNYTDNWIRMLESLKQEYKSYRLVLSGHGNPGSSGAFDRMIKYLQDVKDIIDKSGGDKKLIEERIVAAYPNYKGRHIIPMWLKYMK